MPEQGHESGIYCKTHKVYSLTCEEYEELWTRCGGNCEACGRELTRTRRDHSIDHDHRYGEQAVRGIICSRCNQYLAQLEMPRFRSTFGQGPGRRFSDYFRRAWFMRHHFTDDGERDFVDHDAFRTEMREWRTYNRHLFTRDPKAAVVPTDQPAEIAKILRAEMSHQGFAVLVRILNREAQTPKGMTDVA